MLSRISDLPEGVIGIEAHGKVTKEDYDNVLTPILEASYESGKRVKLMYFFSADFTEFTASAAWEDLQLGLRYLRTFERCAVVTDIEWIRKGTHLMGPLMPCPVRTFGIEERNQAVAWLAEAPKSTNVEVKMHSDVGVLVIEPKGPLASADFDYVASIADPWIDTHHALHGIVIHTPKFPGWENLGSFMRHMRFVQNHHKRVERVAISASGIGAELLPKISSHFVKAEIRAFEFDDFDKAVKWAGHKETRAPSGSASAP